MGEEPTFAFPKVHRTDVCGEWAPNAEARALERAREEAEAAEIIKEVFGQ